MAGGCGAEVGGAGLEACEQVRGEGDVEGGLLSAWVEEAVFVGGDALGADGLCVFVLN